MSIERRRMMMRSRGGVLPYPYKQVEYIESTGTQYIETGSYNIQIGDIIEYTFVPIVNSGRLWIGHYVTPISNQTFEIQNNVRNNYKVAYNFSMTNTVSLGYALPTNAEHTIKIDNLDGILSIDEIEKANFTKVNWSGPSFVIAGNEIVRTMSYKHYRNGELLYNFIPCYDSTDPTKHTAGLYDIVNNQFYGNSGTGYFEVGPDV